MAYGSWIGDKYGIAPNALPTGMAPPHFAFPPTLPPHLSPAQVLPRIVRNRKGKPVAQVKYDAIRRKFYAEHFGFGSWFSSAISHVIPISTQRAITGIAAPIIGTVVGGPLGTIVGGMLVPHQATGGTSATDPATGTAWVPGITAQPALMAPAPPSAIGSAASSALETLKNPVVLAALVAAGALVLSRRK